MNTIFKALKEDHELQRALLDEISKTSGDSPKRRTLYNMLKSELTKHAKYEEQHFYKLLIDEDETQEKARHSIHEHHEIDELVEDLDKKNFSSPHWLRKFKELKDMVEHHLDEEEQDIFPLAGDVLDRREKKKSGFRYEKSMQESYANQ